MSWLANCAKQCHLQRGELQRGMTLCMLLPLTGMLARVNPWWCQRSCNDPWWTLYPYACKKDWNDMNHSVRWCIPCHNHDFDHGDEWCDMMAMAHPQKTVSSFFLKLFPQPLCPLHESKDIINIPTYVNRPSAVITCGCFTGQIHPSKDQYNAGTPDCQRKHLLLPP